MKQKYYNALTLFMSFCLFPAVWILGGLLFGVYLVYEGCRLLLIDILTFIMKQFKKLDETR